MRKSDRRIHHGVKRGDPFEITVNGQAVIAYPGETIGAALVAADCRTLRYSDKYEQPRGLYCGIGLCQECRMIIDGVPNTQACQTLAKPGCRVETQPSNKKVEF